MSERIFALLLRLYPARFRREFGDEALQLVRERLHAEHGLARLWLWFELAGDLVLSLPREHVRNLRRPRVAQPQVAGGGMFWMVEERPPQPGSFIIGAVFALLALSLFLFLLNHGGVARSGGWQGTLQGLDAAYASQATAGQGVSGVPEIDAAERERVIRGVIENVRANYFDKDKAQQVTTALREHLRAGDYDTMDTGNLFSATLNRQLRAVTHDEGLMVLFRADGLSTSHAFATLHVIDTRFGVLVP
ncbi:hypothetical protein [Silvibacterium sp.]|uniref:hypothetical protein n=1 Tax=Silvibacterium sp. TaxID=1964179 RepID=UPI0039E6F0D0